MYKDYGLSKSIVEHSIKGAPVFSLAEILAFKNITALRRLGSTLSIRKNYKLDKVDIIPKIITALKTPYVLQNILDILDETEWEIFERVAACRSLKDNNVDYGAYGTLQSLSIMQNFYHEGSIWFVVPAEIRSIYKKLVKGNFHEYKQYRDLLNKYAIASVSLYGIISQDDFVELFNRHSEKKTNTDEVFSILIENVYAD